MDHLGTKSSTPPVSSSCFQWKEENLCHALNLVPPLATWWQTPQSLAGYLPLAPAVCTPACRTGQNQSRPPHSSPACWTQLWSGSVSSQSHDEGSGKTAHLSTGRWDRLFWNSSRMFDIWEPPKWWSCWKLVDVAVVMIILCFWLCHYTFHCTWTCEEGESGQGLVPGRSSCARWNRPMCIHNQ